MVLAQRVASRTPSAVDRDQLATFVRLIFEHARPQGIISLRTFTDDKRHGVGEIVPVRMADGFENLTDESVKAAQRAADASAPMVFSPPIAAFRPRKRARECDLLAGFCITVELDRNAQDGLQRLAAILGPPTVVVRSGGLWADAKGVKHPKLHLHWRLAKPAMGVDELAKLKYCRAKAALLVGGDMTAASVVHPFRWPGSWHRKTKTPRLCEIESVTDCEIDLDAALAALPAVPGSDGEHVSAEPEASIEEIVFALGVIPNDRDDWHWWNRVAMATWRATCGSEEGFAAFDDWSRKWRRYDERDTIDRWSALTRCPPIEIGVGTIFYLANEVHPEWRSEYHEHIWRQLWPQARSK